LNSLTSYYRKISPKPKSVAEFKQSLTEGTSSTAAKNLED